MESAKKENKNSLDRLFFNKYKPIKKLGEGSFGKIYMAQNINTKEKCALKLEKKTNSQNLLENEAYTIAYLKGFGIPSIKSFGFSGEYNILVMELLGKSLEDLFIENNKKFSLKTVCMIAIQMLERVEFIHKKYIMHRDIKPDNFVIGLDKKSHIIYLLDFGLSKKYRSRRTKKHIPFTKNRKLTGTARYASINALNGFEQSRRDDLEAIGYVLVYFLKGKLPWQGIPLKKNEDRFKKIYDMKRKISSEELCKDLDEEFKIYLDYTKLLGFTEEPNYNYLRSLFIKVMKKNDFKYDFVYDWNLNNNKNNDNQTIEKDFGDRYMNDNGIILPTNYGIKPKKKEKNKEKEHDKKTNNDEESIEDKESKSTKTRVLIKSTKTFTKKKTDKNKNENFSEFSQDKNMSIKSNEHIVAEKEIKDKAVSNNQFIEINHSLIQNSNILIDKKDTINNEIFKNNSIKNKENQNNEKYVYNKEENEKNEKKIEEIINNQGLIDNDFNCKIF